MIAATDAMAKLNPAFISVTYGAGGGTSKNTAKIASHIRMISEWLVLHT